MSADEKFSVVVLAGGRGRRLGGINKATVRVAGRRPIDRVLDAVRPLSDDILIVGDLASTSPHPSVRLVPDALPYHSSLMGVYTGLLSATYELAVVVGCDMPFLCTQALQWVASSARDHDVAVPKIGERFEALHAAYRRSCLPVMRTALERQSYKLIDIFPSVDTLEVDERELRKLDPELRTFMNVNTPGDLEMVRAAAASVV